MVSMLPALKDYQNDDTSFVDVIKVLTQAVEKSIFSKNDISIFDALPTDFDYSLYKKETVTVIKQSLKKDSVGVKRWLLRHQDFINELKSQISSLPIDLIYVIYEVTDDISVFNDSGKPWNELYTWLKDKSESVAADFLLTYFADRDDAFIEQCKVKDIIDEKSLDSIVLKFLNDATRHSAILRDIADVFASKDLNVIRNYIEDGIDITNVQSILGTYLNNLVKENEKDVSQFFDFCREEYICCRTCKSGRYALR